MALQSDPDADVDRRAFRRAIDAAARDLVGDAGSAEMDLSVLRFAFEEGNGHAVVRTRRGAVQTTRAVVACLQEVHGDPVGVHVRGVSGTVRACEEKFI